MSGPSIHGIAPFVPASKLVEATGDALTQIKKDDGLTWGDIGEALGKGEDQAAKYGAGLAEMGFTTWLRACQRWNGRFAVAAPLLGLSVTPLDKAIRREDVRRGILALTMVIADLQKAMLDDTLEDDELAAMDGLIDQAHNFITALRTQIAVIRAANAERRMP